MMKVQDIMTSDVKACTPDIDLATAAMIMWRDDCGTLPVVTPEGRVIGIVTDRDICVAVGAKHQAVANLPVEEVFTKTVYACKPDDDIQDALSTMATHRIRRLPVVNAEGGLMGIVSMDDVVLHAEEAKGRKKPDLSFKDVVETLKAICAHHKPTAVAS